MSLGGRSVRGAGMGRFMGTPTLQHAEDSGLLGTEVLHRPRLIRCDSVPKSPKEASVKIGLEDRRMDIAFPANGFRISKVHSDRLDGPHDMTLCLSLGGEASKVLEGPGRKNCPGPGSEILGGKPFACDGAEILVDVRGFYGSTLAGLIHVLKQLEARELPASFDDPSELWVCNAHTMVDATFSTKFEL